jgi:hypothetical protein
MCVESEVNQVAMLQHELVEKDGRRNWSPRTTKIPDVNKASRVPNSIQYRYHA